MSDEQPRLDLAQIASLFSKAATRLEEVAASGDVDRFRWALSWISGEAARLWELARPRPDKGNESGSGMAGSDNPPARPQTGRKTGSEQRPAPGGSGQKPAPTDSVSDSHHGNPIHSNDLGQV